MQAARHAVLDHESVPHPIPARLDVTRRVEKNRSKPSLVRRNSQDLMKKAVTAIRFLAALIAIHGICLWLFTTTGLCSSERLPQSVQLVFFWVLIAPAFILLWPFNGIFWKLHWLETPGWFAWPKPIAFMFTYGVWVLVLLLLALLIQMWQRRKDA
jgi:hypothetical protein